MHRGAAVALAAVALMLGGGCGSSSPSAEDGGAPARDGGIPDGGGEITDGAAPDAPPTSCGFDYDETFLYSLAPTPAQSTTQALLGGWQDPGPDRIAHADPRPPGTRRVPRAGTQRRDVGDIVIPTWSDSMPLFPRGTAWDGLRCYETPRGVELLSEAEAYDLYVAIAELTTGVAVDRTPEVRSVVGLRGAYPGRVFHHGNLPDRFNDTLVLLWIDADGAHHVREFPANTDTGAYDFGYHSSSSLRPNRRYHYQNGWHNDYNALRNAQSEYPVRDDANKNGYWDSDRNGWLPPLTDEDHDRNGSLHNIHMGSVDAPLGTAMVNFWSAGCQVIPGIDNWVEFITHAWTELGDPVSYYLVDVRDIDGRVWAPCTPDGSHACPYELAELPATVSGDTRVTGERLFDSYNCSSVDESGPEIVFLLTTDVGGVLTATLDDEQGDAFDVDVYLLDADDHQSCLARDDIAVSRSVGPGRYFLVVDTYVSEGVEMPGPFTLTVSLD